MVRRSREKEQKHQYINETEKVLLRGCATKGGNDQISLAAERIRNMPEIFQNVKYSMKRHCQAYQMACDRNFEHLF
ncbi:hypothetical protein TNCV_519381 [Trichonephila clavipes]|nr:hypothetical protein TNCV_519381 [Trichonephila clavipes]